MSALLVIASAAVFVSAYEKAGHQVSVLALARSVNQGQSISPSDLKIVRISLSPGVPVVTAEQANSVEGRTVSVPLVAGSLVSMDDFTSDGGPPPGEAFVGVGVKDSQLPAGGVFPGDLVDVVMTSAPGSVDDASPESQLSSQPSANELSGGGSGSDDQPGETLASSVLVTNVSQPPASSDNDVTVVSLRVQRSAAASVANASAAGQVALVIVPAAR